MKIAIVGTGYVGLVAGTCFADSGNDVTCVDNDARKITSLKSGEIPIYEPGLEELIRRNTTEGRLSFSTDLAAAVAHADVAFIAVGTPSSHDGEADLTAVKAVARAIGRAMTGPLVVVNKSTVPVGTNKIVRDILAAESKHRAEVVSNPEFMKEGAAIEDFTKPDRVVIGTNSAEAADLMRDLYSPYLRTGKPLLVMDPASAELTKYAANALLAAKITFMNEIARVCDAVKADVAHVRQGIGSDARIGHAFLFPGIGYGGSCFPKDIRALAKTSRQLGHPMRIIEAVEAVNQEQKELLVRKVLRRFGDDLRGHTFGVWGLSYKPNTDDMREAPAIVIIEGLLGKGAKVLAYDPEARANAARIFGERIAITDRPYAALEGVSALLAVTEWNEFRRPDFARMKSAMKTPVIFDGRNMYNYERLAALGFEYYGIGTKDSGHAST